MRLSDDVLENICGVVGASPHGKCGDSPHIWGGSGARAGEVPSCYRDYFGNLSFFWGIFRDITPIAARQALGWEFRGFLALG